MQVSVESPNAISRRMTVGIPSEKVDAAVDKRLQEAARSVRINGFRPGKVPLNVVRKRYGAGIRQEVLGELMRDAYLEAVKQQNLRPAGFPSFEPGKETEGDHIEFVAVFEVYPDLTLPDYSTFELERQSASIEDTDVDRMLENLRLQSAQWDESDQPAEEGDKVTLDYAGTVDGEAFEGSKAQDATVQIGSGRMIPGFEDGLKGMSSGDTGTISITFPAEYKNEAVRGKAAQFEVTIKKVSKPTRPEADGAFFKSYGIETDSSDEFRVELKKNMEREARNASRAKLKQQIVDRLLENVSFEVPGALVNSEIDRMRQEAAQRFGGGQQFDASKLPAELFRDQAERRVRTGLVFAQIVKDEKLEASQEQVRSKIEELSTSYQDPEQFVEWFMNNEEQRQQIETAVLEDVVVDRILEAASVKDRALGYEEVVGGQPAG